MRPFAAAVLVAALGIGAAACNRAAADFEDVCNAEERSGAASEPDPPQRAMRIAQWIEGRLRTRDAKRFFSGVAAIASDQKGKYLLEAAREAGYSGPCPMAEQK